MKSQIPSTKLQTNFKFQYSMTKTKNRFGISNFGHCDLFDICYLLFGISIPPRPISIFPGKAIEICLGSEDQVSDVE